jgi:hypothetical protein
VRIGKPWSDAPEGEPLPVERLTGLARKLQAQGRFGVPAALKAALGGAVGAKPEPLRVDDDGFRHFDAAALSRPAAESGPLKAVLGDLLHAARVDAGTAR